jgi:GDP-L-fucose synthase
MVCYCQNNAGESQAIRNQFNKDYVSLMPTNLYGTHDNFDLNSSHVLPACKFHEAKEKQMLR